MDIINESWANCRKCGRLTDRADLISGYCLDCTPKHVWRLRDLSEDYDAALEGGDPAADPEAARIIREYAESERERMADIFTSRYRRHKRRS